MALRFVIASDKRDLFSSDMLSRSFISIFHKDSLCMVTSVLSSLVFMVILYSEYYISVVVKHCKKHIMLTLYW